MKRITRVLSAAALVAVLPFASANAVPVTHNLAVTAGETKTWDGTAAVGANPNYNGLSSSLDPVFGGARTCSANVQTKCEYALVAFTNPVPDTDADGKLSKSARITINGYTLPSPASDFALTVYETDATGAVRGQEVGTSDNTSVPDEDEEVVVTVKTSREQPTTHLLVEVAYFLVPGSGYKGTVKF